MTPEYSLTPIDLSTAGERSIDLEGDYFLFVTALDGSGLVNLDARVDVAFGRAVDDYAPFFINSEAEGYFDKVRVKWAAQSGVIAYLYISRAPIIRMRTPPAKQLVTSALADEVSAVAVTVGTSAVAVAAANSTRQQLTILNNGSVDIYIGPAGVTTSTGLKIAAGQSYSTERCTAAFYAISGLAGQNVRVLEEY